MYAVIKTGGKQYRVAEGDVIRVETLAAEAGDTITFDEVLMVGEGESVKIGTPYRYSIIFFCPIDLASRNIECN